MHLKHIFALLLAVSTFILPSTLSASDFEWRLNLNLRSHSDPYGYRYGLVNRFAMDEADVMLILNRVYEPADAYMIFRLAEISGLSPEYILNVYYERRQYGWSDIALFLGIRSDRHDLIILRERHDMRDVYYEYNHKRKERYEERYVAPVQRHYVPQPPKHYAPVPQRHEQPHHKPAPIVQERHEPKKYEPKRNTETPRPDERHDDNRKHH